MKKLISILTVFAMVLAFAAIPAMAADAPDFTSSDNLAYGREITHISGTYYGSTGSPKTAGNRGKLTDGDFTTEYYSYPPSTKGTVAFQMNLGAVYDLSRVSIYMTGGRTLSIYASTTTDYASGTCIADQVASVAGPVVADATYNELTVNVTDSVYAQYVTFVQTTGGSSTHWREIYIAGTDITAVSDADKVAADKEALTLGDTTAVTANLKLPTAGATFGSTITWATSDESVITAAGAINRVGEDKTATLTATITNGEATDTKTFDVTVKAYEIYNLDLSAENNILLGKTVTHIAGYYYSNSTPSETKQWATDGNLATVHSGYGKVSGATTGVVFSIDLEDEYLIDTLTVLLYKEEAERGFKLYNGSAADETKLIGTYPGPAEANYVVAGEQEAALCVVSCELPEATVASQLTIAYPNGYGFSYYEIAATGRAVQEGEIIRDFTSSDNLAYKKDNERVIGHFYDGWTPASDDLATDGDIATTKRCAGRFSGDDSGSGYYGSAFRIDLGAYYDLTELTLYTTTTTSSISFRSEDAFTVTGSGQQSTPGGYILNSLGGQLHTNGFATVGKDDYELVTVNGTEVYQYSADLSNNAQPVRYIIVHLNGGTWTYNELYVAGTPFTGEVAFAEGDFVYAEDAEAGTKTVTAQVSLMNKTDAATTGNLFYGAYNEAGELVGMTKVADVAVEAGATYSAPTTFAVSAPAGYVKAFYWADGTFVPVIADIICD